MFFDKFNYIMQMNRQWMYGNRIHDEFTNGVRDFIRVANANKKQNGFIFCPCTNCKNQKDYSNSQIVHTHLFRYGFMPSYNCWTKHGEMGVMMEDNEEEQDEDDYHHMYPEYGDTATEEAEGEAEEERHDEPADDLGRFIADERRDCES